MTLHHPEHTFLAALLFIGAFFFRLLEAVAADDQEIA